jgi:RsiW-degrading membrane proteinase PrsW (M82 family)
MLTSVAIAKAITFPITLAVCLALLIRRSTTAWRSLAIFLFGGMGSFSVNSAFLRSLPSFLPPDQLEPTALSQVFLFSFVEAAIPEELSKGIWLLLLLFVWGSYFSHNGAYTGGLIGLGFAMRENLAYSQTAEEWRVLPTLCHSAWGVITGYLLQGAIETVPRRFWDFAGALWPSILLHGIFNATILLVEFYEPARAPNSPEPGPDDVLSPALMIAMLGTLAVVIVSGVWAGHYIRIIRRQLQKKGVPSF